MLRELTTNYILRAIHDIFKQMQQDTQFTTFGSHLFENKINKAANSTTKPQKYITFNEISISISISVSFVRGF